MDAIRRAPAQSLMEVRALCHLGTYYPHQLDKNLRLSPALKTDEEFLSVNLAHCKCRSSSSVESFGAASSFHAQNPLPFEVVHGCFTLNTLDPFTMLIDVKIIVPIGFVSTMELSPCQ
ncbi:hypothetical protein D5086_030692 [Populus alba]|uniref:Uncharacterized protein n=1 Tax=Populus alba TaxID=43335 RepID=A0ACC4AQ14_POPAL